MSYKVPQHIDKNKIFIVNRYATGKKIAVNELDLIGEELKKFIETL